MTGRSTELLHGTTELLVVVDFLYCLYAHSLRHGRIEGRNQSRHFCRNHWSIYITGVVCTGR